MVVVDNHVIRTGSLARLLTALMCWVSCFQLAIQCGSDREGL